MENTKKQSKETALYTAIVIVVLAIVLLGWYAFSAQAKLISGGTSKCTRWKCTDTKTYTCSVNATSYSCENGVLMCYHCTTTNNTKDYVVTLQTIAYQDTPNGTALAGIFEVNNETFGLRAGQTKMLSDMTIFGVTTLYLNYTSFYLQSAYETRSSSLIAPFPKSTTINLILSQSSGCGAMSYSCSNWYVPSCSGNTLTCSLSGYYCSFSKPSTNCMSKGSCKIC